MILRYFQLRMYLRLNWYSQSSYMQCMGLYVFSSSNSLAIIVRKCALDLTFVIKTELWVNSSCVGLEHSNNSMHSLLTIEPTFKSGIRIIYLRQIRSNTKSTQKTDRSLRIDCPHWLLCRNLYKSTQYVALWTHKRHPIPRPFGRAMECLLWVFHWNWPCYKGFLLYFVIINTA